MQLKEMGPQAPQLLKIQTEVYVPTTQLSE